MIGEAQSPDWLAADGLLAQFSTRRANALQQYDQFVLQGIGQGSIWPQLNREVFLGDDVFVLKMQNKIQGQQQGINIQKPKGDYPLPNYPKLLKIIKF